MIVPRIIHQFAAAVLSRPFCRGRFAAAASAATKLITFLLYILPHDFSPPEPGRTRDTYTHTDHYYIIYYYHEHFYIYVIYIY